MSASECDDQPVVPPPGSVSVPEPDKRPVLFAPDGTPLARDSRIGFVTKGRK